MRIMYVAENSCKWRGLPKEYGNWHSVYVKSKRGVVARLCEVLQRENIIRIKIESICIDSTILKVHPDATGALKEIEFTASGDKRWTYNKNSYSIFFMWRHI
ncbi:MAG: IS5/IS1182 family transposase, partial [Endomicrobium sp.]|nr:IS5/IS1182 family transposase [Endomicrobium sp.]